MFWYHLICQKKEEVMQSWDPLKIGLKVKMEEEHEMVRLRVGLGVGGNPRDEVENIEGGVVKTWIAWDKSVVV